MKYRVTIAGDDFDVIAVRFASSIEHAVASSPLAVPSQLCTFSQGPRVPHSADHFLCLEIVLLGEEGDQGF
jgi:hypothetical protein